MIIINNNSSLEDYNTFGLPAKAAYFVSLSQLEQLNALCDFIARKGSSVLWLGGGSNIIFGDDVAAVVVQVALKGVRVLRETATFAYVEVAAGEVWHEWVNESLVRGFSGLENLSLIPGTVGACPVQNIGAYGVEVADCIDSIHCFDIKTRQFFVLSAAEAHFSYRYSIFKTAAARHWLISSVVFRLNKTFTPVLHHGSLENVVKSLAGGREITPEILARAVCEIRKNKLPNHEVIGNAGSFFKNPIISLTTLKTMLKQHPALPYHQVSDNGVKLAAGWLIEACGLKGYAVGGAAVYEKQALVLVNRGGARADDVKQLAEVVMKTVWEKFGVLLEIEPLWLPAALAPSYCPKCQN